jgi:hypothetical protein
MTDLEQSKYQVSARYCLSFCAGFESVISRELRMAYQHIWTVQGRVGQTRQLDN